MKYSQFYLTTIITLGIVGLVVADGAPVVNQFAGGDPASATEVNANFQELADRIDEVPGSQVFDYRNYSSNATSKTFTTTGLCGDTEIRSFVRVDNMDNTTTVTMTRDRQSSSVTCQHRTIEFLASATDFQMLTMANNDTSGTPQNTNTFDEGVVLTTASMRLGVPFGSHSTATNDMSGDNGGLIHTVTVLAVEDVTVPLGTYQNCLKLHITRTSNSTGSFNRLSWRCPAMGEVKRVQHELDGFAYRRWELSAIS